MNRAAGTMIPLLAMIVMPYRESMAYRPFDSTDADVVDPGVLEIELGPFGYLREDQQDILIAPDLVLNLGLSERWELVLEGQHRVHTEAAPGEPRHRLTDTGLFLKGVLREGALQGQTGPSIALEAGALLPTIHGEAGTGGAALLIASYRWPVLTVHLNGEVVLSRSGDIELFGGTIVEGPEEWTVRPVIELFVEGEAGQSPATRSALIGAIWEATDALSVDIGTRFARSNGSREFEVRAGLTWAFALRGP